MLITFERKVPQSSYTSQNDHKSRGYPSKSRIKATSGASSIRLWNRLSKILLSSSSKNISVRLFSGILFSHKLYHLLLVLTFMFPLPVKVLRWESWQSPYGFSNFTSGSSESMHPTQQMHHICWKQDEKCFSIFIPASANLEHHWALTTSWRPFAPLDLVLHAFGTQVVWSAPPSIGQQANAQDGAKQTKQSWLYITWNLFCVLKKPHFSNF